MGLRFVLVFLLFAVTATGGAFSADPVEPPSRGGAPTPTPASLDADCIADEVVKVLSREITPELIYDLSTRYMPKVTKLVWQQKALDEIDVVRTMPTDEYEKIPAFRSKYEHRGAKDYFDWRQANERLNSIPIGELKLTRELIAEVNALATGRAQGSPLRIIGAATGLVRAPFRSVPLIQGAFLRRSLTDAQLTELKRNPNLSFVEVPAPWSKADARVGMILHPSPAQIGKKLQETFDFYEANRETMDPITLAVAVQRRLISIRPFGDGNGRTARLIMDRILREAGLPPAILPAYGSDLVLPLAEHAQEVAAGMFNYLELLELGVSDYSIETIAPSYGTPFVKSLLKHPNVAQLTELWNGEVPPSGPWSKQIIVGGKPIVMGEDGFLRAPEGVPLWYRDGVIYPVPDLLYVRAHMERSPKEKGMKRKRGQIGALHRQVYRDNFRLFRDLKSGVVKADQVRLLPFEPLLAAESRGQMPLQPWQKELYLKSITLEDNLPPAALFSRFATPRSSFEQDPETARRNVADMLGHYRIVDYLYSVDEIAFARTDRAAAAHVKEQRRKLHAAGREMLKHYFIRRERLSPAERAQMSKVWRFKLFESLLKESRLNYASFEEAVRRVPDDTVVVLRGDTSLGKWIGLYPEAVFIKLFDRLPNAREHLQTIGEVISNVEAFRLSRKEKKTRLTSEDAKSLLEYVSPRAQKWLLTLLRFDFYPQFPSEAGSKVTDLINSIVSEPQKFVAESKRRAVELEAHASDSGLKEGLSTTTNSSLLVPTRYGGEDAKPDVPFAGEDASVYLIRMPRDRITWNFMSGFDTEFEFVTSGGVARWWIKEIHTPKVGDGMIYDTSKLLGKVKEFYKKSFDRPTRPKNTPSKKGKKGKGKKVDEDSYLEGEWDGVAG